MDDYVKQELEGLRQSVRNANLKIEILKNLCSLDTIKVYELECERLGLQLPSSSTELASLAEIRKTITGPNSTWASSLITKRKVK